MKHECQLEAEVLSAVLEGRWPENAGEALRLHAAECEICGDVAAVALTLNNARRETAAQAQVPDSAQVWWRAQMHARREAADAACRPLAAAQFVALASAVVVFCACLTASYGWLAALLPAEVSITAGQWAILLAVVGAVVLAPIFVYAAVGKDR